jgi:L-asparaginase
MEMDRIVILCTGGTLEKNYFEPSGSVEQGLSKLEHYLSRLRLEGTPVETVRLMNKDSRDMTPEDRELILAQVRSHLGNSRAVVITHGTDTMIETGDYLRKSLTQLSVPVILTGAMTPLGFEGSDGLQNLAESLLAAKLLAPGIYIVFHNQVFPIGTVRKDYPNARFVHVTG